MCGRPIDSGKAQFRAHRDHAILQTVHDGPQAFDVALGELHFPDDLGGGGHLIEGLLLWWFGAAGRNCRVAPDQCETQAVSEWE